MSEHLEQIIDTLAEYAEEGEESAGVLVCRKGQWFRLSIEPCEDPFPSDEE